MTASPLQQENYGLRVRKKAHQKAELVRAAATLFRTQGYEETRMEDIAIRADVSTKTVYNYFATKKKLLVEILDDDRRRMMSAYDRVVENPPNNLGDALAQLIRADVGDVRTHEDKK